MKKYIASVSFGKDSVAMLLLMLEREPEMLRRVVFFDTGWEFDAVYSVRDQLMPLLVKHGVQLDVVKPQRSFDFLATEVVRRDGRRGWGWCGQRRRWGTAEKRALNNTYLKKYPDHTVCIGLAADEVRRPKDATKRYPLVEWGITEKRALEICRERGVTWVQESVDLYDIFDRLSCYCCQNKNLKELRNMRKHLPSTWERLRALQKKIPFKYKSEHVGVEELDARFEAEEKQQTLKIINP